MPVLGVLFLVVPLGQGEGLRRWYAWAGSINPSSWLVRGESAQALSVTLNLELEVLVDCKLSTSQLFVMAAKRLAVILVCNEKSSVRAKGGDSPSVPCHSESIFFWVP